ncbi:MAG: hypothetical protein ACTSYF_14390 [Promethearchaeota archaeon]
MELKQKIKSLKFSLPFIMLSLLVIPMNCLVVADFNDYVGLEKGDSLKFNYTLDLVNPSDMNHFFKKGINFKIDVLDIQEISQSSSKINYSVSLDVVNNETGLVEKEIIYKNIMIYNDPDLNLTERVLNASDPFDLIFINQNVNVQNVEIQNTALGNVSIRWNNKGVLETCEVYTIMNVTLRGETKEVPVFIIIKPFTPSVDGYSPGIMILVIIAAMPVFFLIYKDHLRRIKAEIT